MAVEWWLQLVVLVVLGATLFHAVRLERALGALRRDRTQLEALLAGLDHSTQEAQSGLERLRGMVDGAGRDITRQAGLAGALRDDLGFLVDRGERLAARLDELVRTGRGLEAAVSVPATPTRAPAAAPAAAVPHPAALPPAYVQPVPEPALPPAPPLAFTSPAAPARAPQPTAQPVLEAMIQHARQSVAQPAAHPAAQAASPPVAPQAPQAPQPEPSEARPVLRSQAERDLLLALRGAA